MEKVNDSATAIAHFERAIELDPDRFNPLSEKIQSMQQIDWQHCWDFAGKLRPINDYSTSPFSIASFHIIDLRKER